MRYIDADRFIEWLNVGHLRSPSEKCFSEYDVKAAIDMQPTVMAWIPFKSDEDGVLIDVPEDGQEILITYNTYFKFVENESYVYHDTFLWDEEGYYLESGVEITKDMAWMPFPEPYKGVEE